jgi:quinol monooxygenase YgiN
MMVITVKMQVRPSKQKELLQTLDELKEVKGKMKRFLDARVCMDNKDENGLTLFEEWETREDADAYMQSEYFIILRGAMKILTSAWTIEQS